jgi:hypothetical protein
MTALDHKNRVSSKVLSCVAVTLALVLTMAVLYRLQAQQPSSVRDGTAFVEKLKSAKHFRSQRPAQMQTLDLAKNSSLRAAALNAIGMELREVRGLAKGDPEIVFIMLSHLGGFGEIIWVDQWTNFPVHLATTIGVGEVVAPRRDAVRAALDAVEASGGCFIKAGENRYLVAKASEKKQYEAAIRLLGWLDGTSPPWDKTNGTSP